MQKCGVWGQESVLSSPGGRVGVTGYLSSSLHTLPLKDTRPLLIFLCGGWAALEPWGLLQKRGLGGPELAALIAGPGPAPPSPIAGSHTQSHHFCFLFPSV